MLFDFTKKFNFASQWINTSMLNNITFLYHNWTNSKCLRLKVYSQFLSSTPWKVSSDFTTKICCEICCDVGLIPFCCARWSFQLSSLEAFFSLEKYPSACVTFSHEYLCWQFSATVTELTLWGRGKMATISQTTFSNASSWMKMFEFRLRFHWSLFLGVQTTISQHWFR